MLFACTGAYWRWYESAIHLVKKRQPLEARLEICPDSCVETQSGFSTSFFLYKKIVVLRSFTADCYLLQPTGVSTEHPHTSQFLAPACTHFNVARDFGSRCLARITSCHHAFGCAFDLILFDPLLFTLHRLSHLPFHSPVLHLHLP